jgi:TM2 domain-containing membrane protein YozV
MPMKSSSTKKNLLHLTLNLVAPGLGQFAAGRRAHGIIMLVAALTGLCWVVYALFQPLYSSVMMIVDGGEPEFNFTRYLLSMIPPFLLIAAVYLWSFADILLSAKKNADKP